MAKANLARVRPLEAANAVSKKDLDDAIGNEKQAEAAVIAAQGEVTNAKLSLGYTTIKSPLTGLSSYARMQEGSYMSAGSSSLLTYVSQLDPIWVNFSLSENEMLSYCDQVSKGLLKLPDQQRYVVEVVLADDTVYPDTCLVDFMDPSYNKDTGTFLVRSVLQGAKGHFVWLLDQDGKTPHQQVVEVGDWLGDNWFISQGLRPGDRIIVDGALRVANGVSVKVTGDAQSTAPASGAEVTIKPAEQAK